MHSRLRALYVTDRFDGPYRYRCQQACEQLRRDGAVANVARIDDPRLLRSLERYGVIVLFRLPWDQNVEALVKEARRLRIPLVFDIDDLTFDPDFAELMPFRGRYSAEKWAATYGRHMAALRLTLDACEVFIGSTQEVAEQAARLGKAAHVHPNVVPDFYLSLGRALAPFRDRRGRPTIGYFSGSDTHDEDFASIAAALEVVIHERPDVRLLVAGYLDLGRRHPAIERHTVRLPYMHWQDFAVAYAACHVTLAPLSVRNAFTDSKSAVKFFEAGAFSTPVVATPVREMARAIEHQVSGLLADTRSEWVSSILHCLDPHTSERLGAAARKSVERRHSSASHRGELHALLERVAVASKGRAPSPSPLRPPDETGRDTPVARALRPVHAARDLVQIFRTLQREVAPASEVARVGTLLETLLGDASQRSRAERHGAVVCDAGDLSGWGQNDDVAPRGDLPGELRASGRDPHLTSPALVVRSSRVRYLVVRMRASAEPGVTRAQIFWKSGAKAGFTEEASASFTVTADGLDATFVVDLAADRDAFDSWAEREVITHLRFDPMDVPGSFRVAAIALLPPLSVLGAVTEPGKGSDGSMTLDPGSDVGPARILERMAGLPPEERLELHVPGRLEASRWALRSWLFGLPVVVERLAQGDDGALIATLAHGPGHPEPAVDIVVPIFNAKELVRRCLSSILRHATGNYRLVAIDDASTDPELPALLEELAREHERLIVLRNPKNLGFVGSANRGMEHAGSRDVLLLNSDTEVFEGFLERIIDTAYSDRRAGMVSPLSNNATICSVPEFCVYNALPEGVSAAEVADVVRRGAVRLRPELVTPHGFCLYVRADFRAAVGIFDAERFGRGFGEENDLGERAKGARYKTLCADDVYVWHEGKGSFGAEGRALEASNAKILAKRHPGYHAAVARFVQENPLAKVQASVRRHLSRKSHRVEPAALLILHASPFGAAPGGVEHCVRDLVQSLAASRVVIAYPESGNLQVAEVIDGDLSNRNLYRFSLGYAPERFCHEHAEVTRAFEEILDLFHIGWVHVHHLMFLPIDLAKVWRARGLPYVVTVHDYYPGCPSFNLLDMRTMTACCPESACDRARTEACQKALFTELAHPIPPDPVAFVEGHRAHFQALMDGAELVTFPSDTPRAILSRLLRLDAVPTEVIPHGHRLPPKPAPAPRPDGPVRIALVGQVAYPSKGAHWHLALLQATAGRDVEWHVFGKTDLFGFDERLAALGRGVTVVQHGPYDRDTIVEKLVGAGIDFGVLVPAWPETFSYTLSEMLAAGLPVVARRIGALADRLDGKPYAVLVDGLDEAVSHIERLCQDRAAIRAMKDLVPGVADAAEWAERHRGIYARCADRSPVSGARAMTPAECFRLNELSVMDGAPQSPVASVTAPASRYASQWWFRYAERAKPYAPESVRQLVRRKLSGDDALPIVRFRLPGAEVRAREQLRIKRRYVATTLFVSQGSDPYLEIRPERPIDPSKVELFRFNMWCSTHSTAYAQIFWQSQSRPYFHEDYSITVPLNGLSATWQEYVVRLSGNARARAWYEGDAITLLRFDPINLPGLIGLGELALCGYPNE